MSEKTVLEKLVDKEFKEVREKSFSLDILDEEEKILKRYISSDIKISIEKLKKIIEKSINLYLPVLGSTTEEFNSIRSLISVEHTLDLSNFTRNVSKLFDISKLSTEYHSKETTTLKDFNTVDAEHKTAQTIYYNNYIKVIATKNIGNSKYKNEYQFKTFSPFYTCFVFRNYNFLHTSYSFIVFNNLIYELEAEFRTINDSNLSAKDKLDQRIITSYLIEKGFGFNYKFFLFNYVKKFYNKLNEWGIDTQAKESLIKEYAMYFTDFRDLYMFNNEDFFKEIDSIISQLLKARHTYLNDIKSDFNGRIFDALCKNKIHEIIDDLFNYMIELCNNSTTTELDIEDSQIVSINKFEKPKCRIKLDNNLWDLVQDYINFHIMTDYNSTYFGTEPKLNMYNYESNLFYHEVAISKVKKYL